MRRALAVFPAVAIMVGLLAGCTSAPRTDWASLQRQVAAVDAAAAQGDPTLALDRLAALEEQAREAEAAGTLAPDRADRILAAIALVQADLQAEIPPPSPSPTPTPTSPPTQHDGGNGGGNDGGNGGGHGHGHGGGD